MNQSINVIYYSSDYPSMPGLLLLHATYVFPSHNTPQNVHAV